MSGLILVVKGKMLSGLLAVLVLCAAIHGGCSPERQAEAFIANPAVEHTAIVTPTPTLRATTTMMEDALKPSSPSSASAPGPSPLPSLEKRIEGAYVVAKVRLLSVATRVERIETGNKSLNDGRFFALYMDFKFEVLEYLKGSGSRTIWGSVIAGEGFDTEQDAITAASDYWNVRNEHLYARWDVREAIVFLYDLSSSDGDIHRGLVRQQGTYLLGTIKIGNGFRESFSIASPSFKSWLPSAQPSGASGASGSEQQFLLDAPGGYAAGGPSGGASGSAESSAPKISLSSLKSKIAQSIGTPTPTATPEPVATPMATPTGGVSGGL